MQTLIKVTQKDRWKNRVRQTEEDRNVSGSEGKEDLAERRWQWAMAINAKWKRRKTEEEKKIEKITTLDPQKDNKKDNESQRRWIKQGNERITDNPYFEIAVKGQFDLFVPIEDEQLSLKTGPLTPTARNVRKRRRLFYIKKHTGRAYRVKRVGSKKFWKKKNRVQSAIALIIVVFWRRDGAVDDSLFSCFRMSSTISSTKSASGLQLEECNHSYIF